MDSDDYIRILFGDIQSAEELLAATLTNTSEVAPALFDDASGGLFAPVDGRLPVRASAELFGEPMSAVADTVIDARLALHAKLLERIAERIADYRSEHPADAHADGTA